MKMTSLRVVSPCVTIKEKEGNVYENIGIMGLGKISHRVAKGIAYAHNAQLYAVASRNIAHAQDFQKQHPCPKAYGSYEELLHDPQVDMVYICTPNYLHYTHIMHAYSIISM